MITLALAKGRILEETLPLLAAAGIELAEDPETSRKLVIATGRADLRLILVRAADVPTYVQYGAADLGVASTAARVSTSPSTSASRAAAWRWPHPRASTTRRRSGRARG